jgi:hypothetical protein
MYNYENQKKNIFTEDGQIMFLQIRDRVQKLLKEAGAFMLENAINKQSGDSWNMLACIDRLVELKEIKEVTKENEVAGQHRVFIKNN